MTSKNILFLPEGIAIGFRRALLWTLAAVYTAALPEVILVYQAIVKHVSPAIAGNIPLAMAILFGVAYAVSIFLKKRPVKYLGLLVPCGAIVYAVVSLEPNPNKHIHISEYVIMSWILFEALLIDYKGQGIFVLVFVCAALLGVVDELAQGIHPDRYYGWHDMAINGASALVGVFTLIGLRKGPCGDRAWRRHLQRLKGLLGLVLFGALGAVFQCVYLFQVQACGMFWGVYPLWLVGWNGLFSLLAPAIVFSHCRYLRTCARNQDPPTITAYLWIFPPLAIIFTMHALGGFVAFSGRPFR